MKRRGSPAEDRGIANGDVDSGLPAEGERDLPDRTLGDVDQAGGGGKCGRYGQGQRDEREPETLTPNPQHLPGFPNACPSAAY